MKKRTKKLLFLGRFADTPATNNLWLTLAGCTLFGFVVLSYAALLPRARWQGDEFILIGLMRENGDWHFQRNFYLAWSPRLLSNALYAVYGAIANATRRPNSAACLALLWAALGSACVAPALRRTTQRGERALIGLALFASFLAGHAVTEVFFWPGGGLSYIPTLAGAVWLYWCLESGVPSRTRQHLAAAAALAIVAGSSEMGIFLALSVCGLTAFVLAWRRLPAAWWLLPGCAIAAMDLVFLLRGRVGTTEILGAGSPTFHHPLASLLAALPIFARELVLPEGEAAHLPEVLASVASRLAIVFAARHALARGLAGERRTLLAPFAGALLLASFATIATAYYQFGTLCCERHETMRACFLVLAVVSLSLWSADWRPPRRPQPNLGTCAWMAAILVLFAPKIPGIVSDIHTMPRTLAVRERNWSSGLGPAQDMVYENEPGGRIVEAGDFPLGTAVRTKDTPWNNLGVLLHFFGKQRVTVVPFENSSRRW